MREVEGLFKDLLVVRGSARRVGERYAAVRNGVTFVTIQADPE
jgi:hypothetical protein